MRVLVLILFVLARCADGRTVRVEWDRNPELAGVRYAVHWGWEGAGVYTHRADVPDWGPCQVLLPDMAPGTYWIAVRAIDAGGRSSEWSDEIEVVVPAAARQPVFVRVQTSDDLDTWTDLVLVPLAPGAPRRFIRAAISPTPPP